MANELTLHYPLTGQTIKGLIFERATGKLWTGEAFTAISSVSTANWATGAVALTEKQTSDAAPTGYYVGTFPPAIVQPQTYEVVYFIGTPIPSSTPIASQTIEWDGTAETGIALVEDWVEQTLNNTAGMVTDLAVDGRLGLLIANLDAAVTSRAPADTALTTLTWTNTMAGYLDAKVSEAGGAAGDIVTESTVIIAD
jgi:hypothetical protein